MNTLSPRKRGGKVAAALVAAVLLGLTGCVEPENEADVVSVEGPATKQDIEGTDLHRIILTEQAIQRLDLTTATVATGAGGLEIPYGALIYTADGGTWVYTNPEPLVFIRAEVVVDRIDGGVVRLSKGPAPGTKIVTVGAAELYGAEFDAAH